MKALRLLTLVSAFALTASPAMLAQEKQKKIAGADVQPAVQRDTLKHGTNVTFKRKDGTSVRGTVVWQDGTSDRIFVRTKPGAPPVGVALVDIEDLQRIMPAAGAKDEGSVRPAVDTAAPPVRVGYEIHVLEVYNGPTRSVQFYDSSLSPTERAKLREIAQASERVADSEQQVANLSRSMQQQTLETASMQNSAFYGWPLTYTSSPLLYTDLSVIYGTPFAPYGSMFGGPFGARFGSPFGAGFGSPLGYSFAPTNTTVVVQNRNLPANSTNNTEVARALSEAQERLSKHRQESAALADRAVLDPNGRIIAVRFEK